MKAICDMARDCVAICRRKPEVRREADKRRAIFLTEEVVAGAAVKVLKVVACQSHTKWTPEKCLKSYRKKSLVTRKISDFLSKM